MSNSPKAVSNMIADKPADAVVSPPKVPANTGTNQVGETESAADTPAAKQEPTAKPDLLKV